MGRIVTLGRQRRAFNVRVLELRRAVCGEQPHLVGRAKDSKKTCMPASIQGV